MLLQFNNDPNPLSSPEEGDEPVLSGREELFSMVESIVTSDDKTARELYKAVPGNLKVICERLCDDVIDYPTKNKWNELVRFYPVFFFKTEPDDNDKVSLLLGLTVMMRYHNACMPIALVAIARKLLWDSEMDKNLCPN